MDPDFGMRAKGNVYCTEMRRAVLNRRAKNGIGFWQRESSRAQASGASFRLVSRAPAAALASDVILRLS